MHIAVEISFMDYTIKDIEMIPVREVGFVCV